MLRRNFSSAIMLGTLTFYHSVIFLAVIGVRKAPGLLAARLHLLAGAICNFIAGLIAATLDHLLAAFDLIAACANRAATLGDVAHAVTASLDFNVAVLFLFFLCNLGYFYFNKLFLFLQFNRLNWDFPGYFCDLFCFHFWNYKWVYFFFPYVFSCGSWLDVNLFPRSNFNRRSFGFPEIVFRSDLSDVHQSSFGYHMDDVLTFWNLGNQGEKHSCTWAVIRHSGLSR